MFCFFMILAALGAVEGEAITVTEVKGLHKSLELLGSEALEEELPEFCAYVMEEPLELEARLESIARYYEKAEFTEHHGGNLYAHIRYGSTDPHKMARFAGAFAAMGLRHSWDKAFSQDILSLMPILPFLESLYNDTPEDVRKSLAAGIEDVLGETPLPLKDLLSPEKGPSEEWALQAMQHCITLGACAQDFDLLRWIDLPRSPALFYKSTGQWLFGGEALNGNQLKSLESVFSTLPLSLHGIAAVFVPEGLGHSGAEASLRIPGYSIQVPLLEMDIQRDNTLQPPYISQPGIPEFTALILEQVAEAITRLQLMKRPDLMQRSFQILDWERKRPGAGLDQIIPEPLMGAPADRLLAHLVYLWLINSDAWLESSLALAELQRTAPFLLLLLAADVFSEASDQSRLLHTTPGGRLFSEQTALRRTPWVGTGNTVTAIASRGKLWHYEDSAPPVPWSF
ncbi:MAG: hypothetical protein GX130_01075 [Candidatus Hydrogenedens sp.]|nr:hypothetical protein [Candidatus Hydrogenedens sp.]